jgi:hypothetical protein
MPFAISTSHLRRLLLAGALLVLAAVVAAPASGHRLRAQAHAAAAQQCAERSSATRDPSNPLDLASAPGADPLTGAHFFVDGPAHGGAAGAIASLLGINPASQPDSESWASFDASLGRGDLGRRIASDPSLARRVNALAKIAAQPEVQRLSAFSRGGGPGGVFLQAEKLLCKNITADPNSVPILNTYFLHPAAGPCPTPGALRGAVPVFQRRVNEFAAAIDRRPAVLLLETDSIGSSRCIERVGSLPTWESMLRYEISTLAKLPHVVIYTEGGYSDSNSPAYTAKVLNAIGVAKIRGFYTNDTHLQWTINEVRWATKVSRLTHGAHFIVNTAQNGHGPLLNRHPSSQGIENLCNPPGRGLGPLPTTHTGFALADAWLWTSPPGNSSGCGGGPPGGIFWPARAESLALRANGKLGPGYPSRPY